MNAEPPDRKPAVPVPVTYFDCRDSERLSHETVEEAVADWLEMWFTPDCDVVAVIREHAPVEVTEFQRDLIDPGFVERTARHALEWAAEHFSENFGDPDGDDDGLSGEAEADALPLMVAAIERFYNHATVWGCSQVDKRTLDAAEIETLMRQHQPEWFEKREVSADGR